jgi:hypothetical protein
MKKLSDNFYHDIMSTAVEGGINHWADVRNPVYDIDDNLHAFSCRDNEDPSAPWLPVSKETVHTGIESVFASKAVSPEIVLSITQACADEDAGQIDADGADVIIQLALFKEVIYS